MNIDSKSQVYEEKTGTNRFNLIGFSSKQHSMGLTTFAAICAYTWFFNGYKCVLIRV